MGIVSEDLIAVDINAIGEGAETVEITVNGLTYKLTEVKKTDEEYSDRIEKIKNHNNWENSMILFQYNPTCFWYQGRLYCG